MKNCLWKDYELMDTAVGERLERWEKCLIRPDHLVLMGPPKENRRLGKGGCPLFALLLRRRPLGEIAAQTFRLSGGFLWRIDLRIKSNGL